MSAAWALSPDGAGATAGPRSATASMASEPAMASPVPAAAAGLQALRPRRWCRRVSVAAAPVRRPRPRRSADGALLPEPVVVRSLRCRNGRCDRLLDTLAVRCRCRRFDLPRGLPKNSGGRSENSSSGWLGLADNRRRGGLEGETACAVHPMSKRSRSTCSDWSLGDFRRYLNFRLQRIGARAATGAAAGAVVTGRRPGTGSTSGGAGSPRSLAVSFLNEWAEARRPADPFGKDHRATRQPARHNHLAAARTGLSHLLPAPRR